MAAKMGDCLRTADEVKRVQGVLTLLWHPPIFNPREYPDARDMYIALNQYCKENGAWTARARDIYEWLSLRKQQTFSVVCRGSLYSIVPTAPSPDCYFTLYPPPGTECTIHSGNAEVIRKDGECIYIKTHNLQKNDEIIVGFT